MKPLAYSPGFLLVLTLLGGCKTECEMEPCTSTPLPVKSLEGEYGCQDTRRNLTINLSETHTVIRSQVEFDQLVSGPCHPLIDFTTYDLVIGKKGLSSGNAGINYTFRRDCVTSKPMLHVEFRQGLTTEAPNITYHALVPKLNPGEQIGVEIDVKYQ
ncbi:hypothetical protein [Hymenobacter lucidus]|uniref:Lipoprotein n=1 Tax=Hymenobacter lucidus TaxID=2880930 RepID=A0ABS8APK3_9BACT|nr:hypothetical protein [Hymenobacter lucidus]MCB2408143.1 hypothetical protein [Hymenobacter lucidus]